MKEDLKLVLEHQKCFKFLYFITQSLLSSLLLNYFFKKIILLDKFETFFYNIIGNKELN